MPAKVLTIAVAWVCMREGFGGRFLAGGGSVEVRLAFVALVLLLPSPTTPPAPPCVTSTQGGIGRIPAHSHASTFALKCITKREFRMG